MFFVFPQNIPPARVAPAWLQDALVVPRVAQVQAVRVESHLHIFGECYCVLLHQLNLNLLMISQIISFLRVIGQIEQKDARLGLLVRFELLGLSPDQFIVPPPHRQLKGMCNLLST